MIFGMTQGEYEFLKRAVADAHSWIAGREATHENAAELEQRLGEAFNGVRPYLPMLPPARAVVVRVGRDLFSHYVYDTGPHFDSPFEDGIYLGSVVEDGDTFGDFWVSPDGRKIALRIEQLSGDCDIDKLFAFVAQMEDAVQLHAYGLALPAVGATLARRRFAN